MKTFDTRLEHMAAKHQGRNTPREDAMAQAPQADSPPAEAAPISSLRT